MEEGQLRLARAGSIVVKEGKYDILKTASLKLSELGFVNME